MGVIPTPAKLNLHITQNISPTNVSNCTTTLDMYHFKFGHTVYKRFQYFIYTIILKY